jgi:transposase-like protein
MDLDPSVGSMRTCRTRNNRGTDVKPAGTGQRYSEEERRLIVEAMERDVARRGSAEPDYTALSRTLGPDPSTLKRWWRQRSAPKADATPSGPTHEEEELAAWLLHHDDDDEVVDALVTRGLAMVREARQNESWTAAARMDSEIRQLVLEHRAKARPTNTGPATPDEWVALVVQMPEVLLEAWMASPELWTDPRWTAAREGR